jgi:hypothetical protein
MIRSERAPRTPGRGQRATRNAPAAVLLATILLPEGMSGLAWGRRGRTVMAGAEPHPRMEALTPLPFFVLRQYLTLPWQCYSVSSVFFPNY